jgi:hypothetical protein
MSTWRRTFRLAKIMRTPNHNLFISEWPWVVGALLVVLALEYARWDADATKAISNLSAPMQGVVVQTVAGAAAIEIVLWTIALYMVTTGIRTTMRAVAR